MNGPNRQLHKTENGDHQHNDGLNALLGGRAELVFQFYAA